MNADPHWVLCQWRVIQKDTDHRVMKRGIFVDLAFSSLNGPKQLPNEVRRVQLKVKTRILRFYWKLTIFDKPRYPNRPKLVH